jgi:hypothetical protein
MSRVGGKNWKRKREEKKEKRKEKDSAEYAETRRKEKADSSLRSE